MQVIDAQVHVWEESRAAHHVPTAAASEPEPEVPTVERLIAKMNGAGVDASLLFPHAKMYGFDNAYSLDGAKRFPDRLAVVGNVDTSRTDPDALFATWRAQPGMLGWRLVLRSNAEFEFVEQGPGVHFLAAAARHGVPLCVYAPGQLRRFAFLPPRFPDLQFVVDHLGIGASEGRPVGLDPFDCVPDLLELAAYPNVAVKATGLPTWSHQAFPFADVWPPLHKVLGAFGLDRVMWGTDFTHHGERVQRVPYEPAVRYVVDSNELSASDKEMLLGKALRKVFRWSAAERSGRTSR